MNFRGFVFAFTIFLGGWILRLRFDPSRDPYGSSERLGLESTGEETSHRVRRLLLHGSRDVGVGIEGKPGGVVPQHGGQGFYVHPVLQGQHRKCVTKVVEAYPLQSCPFQNPLEHVQNAVRGHRASVWRGEDVFVLLLYAPEDFNCICSYHNIAVGIFRFQRGLDYFPILAENLSSDVDDPLVQINVAPFQTQQFSPPEASCEVDVVQLKYTAAFRFLEEGSQTFRR